MRQIVSMVKACSSEKVGSDQPRTMRSDSARTCSLETLHCDHICKSRRQDDILSTALICMIEWCTC